MHRTDFPPGQAPDHRDELLIRRLNARAEVEDLPVKGSRAIRCERDGPNNIVDVHEIVDEARLRQR
jgi:hypothetical protein